MEISVFQWLILNFAAFMYGFNKTGVLGSAILCTPIMMLYFPPSFVMGILVPLLIVADIITVTILKKEMIWRHIFRALPWATVGIAIGWLIAKLTIGSGYSDQNTLRKVIAGVLVFLLLFGYVVRRWPELVIPTSAPGISSGSRTWFAATMGTMAGITTMLANNGGPAWIVYLSSLGMDKRQFLATAGWLYLFQNLAKVPFAINLGMITSDTLLTNLWLLPALAVGLAVGNQASKRISLAGFRMSTQILAMCGALYLLVI